MASMELRGSRMCPQETPVGGYTGPMELSVLALVVLVEMTRVRVIWLDRQLLLFRALVLPMGEQMGSMELQVRSMDV